MNLEFKPLSVTTIYQVLDSSFKSFNRNITIQQIKKYILPKLSIFKKAQCIIENEYIETEWKEMVSMHYVNTSYELKNTVIRFHVFANKEFEMKNYLGFFTLRPIDEVKVMMSFIYPNWNNIQLEKNNQSFIMTYEKNVHIMGKTFSIWTYPIFCQDSVVTSCAHANIISMGKYLHQKIGVPKLTLKDINESYVYERSKIFPTKGLVFGQMLEILFKNNWHIVYEPIWGYCQKEKDASCDISKYDNLKKNIDVNLESALPVLLNITFIEKGKVDVHHILQIIGHTAGDVKKYIILDDSGMFMNEICQKRETCALLTWEEMVEHLFKKNGFVMYPQYEKVYMMYKDIKIRMEPIILGINKDEVNNLYKRLKIKHENIRYLLVDNVVIKNFLAKNIRNHDKIQEIIAKNHSHYLWYCETKINDFNLVFLADSTYNHQTTKDIFISNEGLLVGETMSLLTTYHQHPNYSM